MDFVATDWSQYSTLEKSNRTCLFVDNSYVIHDLVPVSELKLWNWTLLCDNTLIHYKTLDCPPITFIPTVLPDTIILQKLKKIYAFLSTNNQKKEQHKIIELTDLKRNTVAQSLDKILYVKGYGDYSNVFHLIGEYGMQEVDTYGVSHNLKYLEEQLSPSAFFRIHKSYLINMNHLHSDQNFHSNTVKMVDSSQISIARRRKKDFLSTIEMKNRHL